MPPALEPWREWVLYDQADPACPHTWPGAEPSSAGGTATARDWCQWPGRLNLAVQSQGADFTQEWIVFAAGFVPLPGTQDFWPTQVTADGTAVPVVSQRGTPVIFLPTGQHQINGVIRWQQQPELLQLPPSVALVSLQVNGTPVANPEINPAAQLWLGERRRDKAEQDELTLIVGREIHDGHPLRITTIIDLYVYGRAREESIGPVLLPGFEPLAVTSALPVRLQADGTVQLQLRPGVWSLTVESRALELTDHLRRPESAPPWPDHEIWTFIPDHGLRNARVDGGTVIDATQNEIPNNLNTRHQLYLMGPESDFNVLELGRGQILLDNEIGISRDAWLTFDGDTLFYHDHLFGFMEKDWRLDALDPFTTLHAKSDNYAGQPVQLITRLPATPAQEQASAATAAVSNGFEWRQRRVDVNALMRSRFQSGLPLAAWNTTLDQLDVTLNIPPGYRLIGASGFDQVSGAWLNQWNVLEIFLTILSAVLVYQLAGWRAGLVAIVFLMLSRHEPWAPNVIVIVSATLLLLYCWSKGQQAQRWLGRLAGTALLLFLLQYLAFAFVQLQSTLYPQLEPQQQLTPEYYPSLDGRSKEAETVQAMHAPASPPAEDISEQGQPARKKHVSPLDQLTPYDPDAYLQAGAGIPAWEWHRHRLHRSGPITVTEQQTLLIAPPWFVALWRLLSVCAGLGLLAWLSRSRRNNGPAGRLATAFSTALLACGLANAQEVFPPQEHLQALQQRLTAAPECAPTCAKMDTAHIATAGNQLQIQAQIHSLAQTTAALPWPATDETWSVTQVRLNGRPAAVFYADNEAHIALPQGIHQLSMTADLARSNEIALLFPLRPEQVTINLQDWTAAGLHHQRLNGRTLTLYREAQAVADDSLGPAPGRAILPYVKVVREINLDLRPFIATRVSRVAPQGSAIHVDVPLLTGEQYRATPDAGVNHVGNTVQLTLDSTGQKSWTSELPLQTTYQWTAPSLAERVEVWQLIVSPTLHADINGVPLSEHPAPLTQRTLAYYYFLPRPGETLQVTLTRPIAEAGNTIAFDQVALHGAPGRTQIDYSLRGQLRVTRPDFYTMRLPAEASVLTVELNGQTLSLQAADGQLEIPVSLATRTLAIHWTQPLNNHWHITTASPDLGQPAANITTTLDTPGERWLLWTYGAGLGPAVQFWSLLLLLALAAGIFSRAPLSPLRFHHWLILGLGFSTVNSWSFLFVAAFFFVAAYRGRHGLEFKRRWVSILVQLGLSLFAASAALVLVNTVIDGLLSRPDMHIANPQYGRDLQWFVDHSSGVLPESGIISAPIWLYRAAMLVWSLWLSLHLAHWLRWVWDAMGRGGFWPPKREKQASAAGTGPALDNDNGFIATENPHD